MATAGETFLRAQHLTLLNRLRRMGTGKMKLASELTPEKRATIVKRLILKARPITEGVVPKEAGWLAGMAGKAKSMFARPALAKATVGVAPAMKRPTAPPGARAAAFGTKPLPGIHTGMDVSKALGHGPSSGDWEHLGAEEARAMLKMALLRRRT